MITVYGRATSSNVQLVMWAIAELGIEAERLDYGHVHGGTNTEEYGNMNPNRLVPTLRDDKLVLWESAAILRYLGARYGSETFWPSDPVVRAPVDMWAEWGKITLSQAFTVPVFWPRVRMSAAERDERKMLKAIANVDRLLEIAALQLGKNPFICGSDLTAADIAIGHILYRWMTIDIERRPNAVLKAYYERLTERSAYRDNVMVSYASLYHPDAG